MVYTYEYYTCINSISEHQSQWGHASFITGRFGHCGVDCLQLASLAQRSRNYGPFSSKQPKTLFCANIQPQLLGYENATATPVSHFHLLSKFYTGSSPNSTCSFSDYSTFLKKRNCYFTNPYIFYIISRPPLLFSRFFPDSSDIFKLITTFLRTV